MKKSKPRKGLVDAAGNTVNNSLSEATGCEIQGKYRVSESRGSVKDRVAVKIIEEGGLVLLVNVDQPKRSIMCGFMQAVEPGKLTWGLGGY